MFILIYLDHNATTPLAPEVREAMLHGLDAFGNPSSSHRLGREAKEAVERGRAQVAALIGASPEEIYFTSGGTESNNLAILGTARRFGKGHIIASQVEHPSVANAVRYLMSKGFDATFVPVDGGCRISPDDVRVAIRKDTILITVMHSNNETGVLQPVGEIDGIAAAHGIAFHTDAAQSAGKIPLKAEAGMMTMAAHKLYGPKGIGALFVKKTVELMPIAFGAGHERGLRPGTENVPGIAGMGKACEIALRDMEHRVRAAGKLRGRLLEELLKKVPDLKVNGHEWPRLPNTLNVRIPGSDAASVVEALKDRLALSSGSACHAGSRRASSVLRAMGLTEEEASASLRLTLGMDNTEEEIIAAAGMISEALN